MRDAVVKRLAGRALKWLLPTIILAGVLLSWTDLLEPRDAVLLLAGIETLLLLAAAGQVLVAARRYRRGRATGLDAWAALEDGLAAVLPRTAAKLVMLEPRLWACLVRWASRRAERREGEFGYHRRSLIGILAAMVVLVSPVEILLFQLLLESFVGWAWLEALVLFVELYAAFWIVGLHASIVVLPHRLKEEGILLRYGVLAHGFIPYSEIQNIIRERRNLPKENKRRQGLQIVSDEDAAYFAISGKTDVLVRLKRARPMEGLLRPTPAVTSVRFAADDPEGMTRELRRRTEPGTVKVAATG